MDDGSFVFQGQGTLYNQTGQSVYQGLWEDGTRSGNGTAWLEDGSIYSGNWVDDTRMERVPTFFPMGLNTREDSSVEKNMAKEPSKKPTDSSVMMVNGRMVKGLEKGGSINVTVRVTMEIG